MPYPTGTGSISGASRLNSKIHGHCSRPSSLCLLLPSTGAEEISALVCTLALSASARQVYRLSAFHTASTIYMAAGLACDT